MHTIKLAMLFLLLCACASCDPFHSLVIDNKTRDQKHIEVVEMKIINVSGIRDSIRIYRDALKDEFQFSAMTSVKKNVEKNSYSFYLDSGMQVTAEMGFGSRPIARKIIVNATDTFTVNGKMKKSRLTIGGNYVLRLGN